MAEVVSLLQQHERLAEAYLQERASSLDTLTAVKCEAVSDLSRIDKDYPRRPGIVFWFFDPLTGEQLTYVTAKGQVSAFNRVKPLGRDWKGPKFLQPKDSGVHAFAVNFESSDPEKASNWSELRVDKTTPVILVEGETRPLACAERGLPAVGITGVTCWQRDGVLLPFLAEIAVGREVVLALDSDQIVNEETKRNKEKLAQALYAAGAERVLDMALPWKARGEKIGLDDYLAEHSTEDLIALYNSPMTRLIPKTTALEPLSEITVAEILKREVAPVEELIPGWVQKGIPNFIAGPGGVHKSRLAMQWSLCLNAGASVWGIGAGLLQKPATQLVYVSAEDDENELARRAQAITAALKLGKPKQGVFIARKGKDSALVTMRESAQVEVRPFHGQLMQRLKAIPGHKVVVLDSAYDFVRFANYGKIDEDSVNYFIKVVLQQLCDETDSTLLIPWHPSQAGSSRSEMDGWSVAWHNAPRSRMALSEVKDIPDAYELKVVKRNHGRKGEPLVLRFYDGALLPLDAVPDDGKAASVRKVCVDVATKAAATGMPFTMQRHVPNWALDEIEKATGKRYRNVEVKELLSAAANDGALRYVKGSKYQVAGFYPNDDTAGALARRSLKKGTGSV